VERRFSLNRRAPVSMRAACRRRFVAGEKVIGGIHKLFTAGLSIRAAGLTLFFAHFSDKKICRATDTFIFSERHF
jgi:hypothetical protein